MVRAPFSVERYIMPANAAYDFRWSGATACIAWHDIILSDGIVQGSDVEPSRHFDMRQRLTFTPKGANLWGWGQPTDRSNSFTVLAIDQDWLFEELETEPSDLHLHTLIGFKDAALMRAMQRLTDVAVAKRAPRLMADSLVFLVGVELLRVLSDRNSPQVGGLSDAQLKAATDFIDAHITEDVSLVQIAAAAGLSVFHFGRAFKTTMGLTPYRYVIEKRIERAKELIARGSLPLSLVAAETGFKSSSHFSRTFTEIVGVTPRSFRLQAR